jgi:hypothetical protein
MGLIKHGGGWPAIWYTLKMGRKVGFRNMWKALSSKNTCKTCALGMGGQSGGMRNEQVLQVFFEERAFHILGKPTFRPIFRVYQMAGQPPPCLINPIRIFYN